MLEMEWRIFVLQELVDAPMVRAATSAAIHKGRSLAWFETALEGVWVDPDRDNDDKTTQLVRIQKKNLENCHPNQQPLF